MVSSSNIENCSKNLLCGLKKIIYFYTKFIKHSLVDCMKKLSFYTIWLIFVGLMSITSCQDEVGPPPPNSDFFVTNNFCTAPCTLYFKNASEHATSTFEWDFGNGKTGNTEDTAIRYDYEGVYDVYLTSYNEEGASSESRKTVEIMSAMKALVTQIKLTDVSFTKNDGLNWDTNGYPDVFIKIRKDDSEIWNGIGQTQNDLDESQLPVSYATSSVWDDYKGKYFIDVMDNDSTDHHEPMHTFECSPETFNEGSEIYPDSLTLKDGSFEVVIYVNWED